MRILLALVVGLMTGAPSLAWAQTTATAGATQRRGERALFGGGVGDVEQALSVSSNAGISFFENLTPQLPSPDGETAPTTTRTSRASGSLAYSLDVPYARVGASFTGFSYYQPPPRSQWFKDYSFGGYADTGRTWRMSRRSQLSVSQNVSFQPEFQELLPNGSNFGTADPSQIFSPDVATFDGQILRSNSTVGFNYDFSRRVSFYNSYGFYGNWTFGREGSFDRVGHRAISGLRFALTRHLSVRGGYRFEATRQLDEAGMPYVRTQGADVGIDYNRGGGLRLTRRTFVSFGVGLGSTVDTDGGQRYHVLGNIDLIHEIGRTWSASVAYSRNVDFSSLFLEPTLSDNFFADFGGLITSRLSFQSAVGYTTNAVGFSGGENRYDTAHGLVGLQSGLTRYVAFGVNYTYYYRSIGRALEAPSGLATYAESQAVHVFVSVWAPLYQRTRRPNGTR